MLKHPTNREHEVVGSVELLDTGVIIRNVYIDRREVLEYVQRLADGDRSRALAEAVEVGVFCLERARSAQDMEFVRRQIDHLLQRVEAAAQSVPSAILEQVLSRLGTHDGQALAPVRACVEEARRAVTDKLQDVRTLFAEDLDPRSEGSRLGMVLRTVSDLLDPDQKHSIQATLTEAVGKVAAEDGVLARTVKGVVHDAVRPLADEINRLAAQVQADQAVKVALERTTAKGAPYEEEVLQAMHPWARYAGVEVHHVGGDNQAGDILVVSSEGSTAGVELSIVIETRDRTDAVGRRRIAEDLNRAMAHRNAKAAVYVSRTRAGLGAEVGDWAEGACEAGYYVATTHDQLTTALRYLLVRERMALQRSALPVPDIQAMEAQVHRIRRAMERISEISRKVTTGKGALEAIQGEAEAIRADVRDALLKLEDSLRIPMNS